MKKQLLILVPALILLASCGTRLESDSASSGEDVSASESTSESWESLGSHSGFSSKSNESKESEESSSEDKSVSISGEEISDSEGQDRLASIEDNLATVMADKCVTVTDNMESGDFAVTYSGLEMTMNYNQSLISQYDIVDNELYMYIKTNIIATYYGQASETISETYAYYFDEQYAQKGVTSNSGSSEATVTRDVSARTMDVASTYVTTIETIIAFLDTYSWTDITYYGGEDSNDIRVVATGEDDSSLDMTFDDGLITSLVMAQMQDLSTALSGMTGTFLATERMSFTYSSSLDIPHPDLTSSDW